MSDAESNFRKVLFGRHKADRAAKYNICLAPDSECEGAIIRAHSVQNSRVLESIVEDGHVIMPKLFSSFERGAGFRFESISRYEATTFTGLCQKHDRELFRPIETGDLDLSDAGQLFLFAYRAVLRQSHAVFKTAEETQTNYTLGVEAGLFPDPAIDPANDFSMKYLVSAYWMHELNEWFAFAYRNREWGLLSHTVLNLREPPTVAVNAMYRMSYKSRMFDAPIPVAINVLPINGETYLVVSALADDFAVVRGNLDRMLSASGDHRLYELSKLIVCEFENFALRPSLYSSFSERQRSLLLTYFERNITGHSFKLEDPALFLFRSVA